MIIIDAGHGGKDSGCVGNGLKEKDLTLKISLIQQRLCEIYGIECILTRTKDEFIELKERTRKANTIINTIQNRDNIILISNHINDSAKIAKGFEIWKSVLDTSDYPKIVEEMIEKSDILFNRGIKTRQLTSGRDYFHMIREAGCASYILEWGFIKNERDMKSLANNILVASSIPIVAYLKRR